MDRKAETKAVKAALKKAGYDVTVRHGTGTAWGWLEVSIEVDHAPGCECYFETWGTMKRSDLCIKKMHDIHDDILRITQKVTGRHGDYDGNINIYMNFKEVTQHE